MVACWKFWKTGPRVNPIFL